MGLSTNFTSGLADAIKAAGATTKEIVDGVPKEEFKEPAPVVQPVEPAATDTTNYSQTSLSQGDRTGYTEPVEPVAPVAPAPVVDDGVKKIGLSGAELLSTEAPGGDKDTVAAQHFSDILQGQDSATNKLLMQFSEGSAARDAAARGAAGQKAQQAGMSEGLQALAGRETTRDLEQARVEGITDIATDLAKRQDVAARDLYAVGQDEKNAAWVSYQDMLVNADIQNPEIAQQALDAQYAATGVRGNIDKLINDRWDATRKEANGDMFDYLTTYGEDYYDEATKSYNVFNADGSIIDGEISSKLEDSWNAMHQGDPDRPFDPQDPEVKDWINRQVDLGTETENDSIMTSAMKGVDEFLAGTDWDQETKDAYRASYSSYVETELYLGGNNPERTDDFGFGGVYGPNGELLVDKSTVTDEDGTAWNLNRDTAELTGTDANGVTTNYIKKDGDWFSVREYSDAYKEVAGVDAKETKLSPEEVNELGFNNIDVSGKSDELNLLGDEVTAPNDLPTYGLFESGGKTYIKNPTEAVEYQAGTHFGPDERSAWSKQDTLTDIQRTALSEYVTDTAIEDLPKSLIENLLAQGDPTIIEALGNSTSDAGMSGDATRSGDRSKFTDVSQGDYITIDGQIYEVTGSIGSINYKSQGRTDGDVKRVSKNHYAQVVEVTNPITGEKYELQSLPTYDQGHLTSADKRDTNVLPTLYL